MERRQLAYRGRAGDGMSLRLHPLDDIVDQRRFRRTTCKDDRCPVDLRDLIRNCRPFVGLPEFARHPRARVNADDWLVWGDLPIRQ